MAPCDVLICPSFACPPTGPCHARRDLSDCGWRSQPRTVPQGVARSNDCYLDGPLKGVTTTTCIDLNDHWAISDADAQAVLDIAGYWNADGNPTTHDAPNMYNGWVSIQKCPLGTQTAACGERPIYIAEDDPGGCHQTCEAGGRNFAPGFVFDPHKTCSDGGEGSFRVPFLMPDQLGNGNDIPPNYQHMPDGYYNFPPNEQLVYWCAATHSVYMHSV